MSLIKKCCDKYTPLYHFTKNSFFQKYIFKVKEKIQNINFTVLSVSMTFIINFEKPLRRSSSKETSDCLKHAERLAPDFTSMSKCLAAMDDFEQSGELETLK